MAEPRSGPLSSPLAQFGLGAVVLVAVAALLFAVIGAVTDGDPVASGPAVDDTPTGTATTATTEAPTTSGTEVPTGPTTGPVTEAPPTTEGPTTTAPPTDPQIDPATVSVQVLDGVGDSEQQFEAVTACLDEAGYGPLITNDAAVAYETTEVFYTAGEDNDAAARQVAAAIGVSDVEEKPDSLSDSVPVHVVVGRDATAPC